MPLNCLFFSPFQAIEAFSYPEAFLAKTLRAAGHEVTFMGCDGLLENFCIAHSAHGLTEISSLEEKRAVCKICKIQKSQLAREFGTFLNIEDFYDPSIAAEIEPIVASTTIGTIPTVQFHGILVGRIAAYEFILNHKLPSIESMAPGQFPLFQENLRKVLSLLLITERFLARKKVDRIFIYNTAYSLNNIVREVAVRAGVPVSFLHGSYNLFHRLESFYLGWEQIMQSDRSTIQYFEKHYPALNLDYSRYQLPLAHIKEQLGARSVFTYSQALSRNLKQVAENLNIDARYKKVVLLSMSSFDEAYAADYSLFNGEYYGQSFSIFGSQLSWLVAVIEHFRNRPEFKLIVRVHPRMFPNKRENVRSASVEEFKSIFEGLPPNVSVDYPDMKNSIYDLFEMIDFHLISQSTTGCESAGLGIPGLACVWGLGNYPIRKINPVPNSADEYFKTLDLALAEPSKHSRELANRVFDWYLFLHTLPVIYCPNGSFWKRAFSPSIFDRIIRKLRKAFGLPRFSLAKFLSASRMDERDTKAFLRFTEQTKEFLEIREEAALEVAPREPYFREYLKGVLESYAGLELASFSRFSYRQGKSVQPASGECIFLEADDVPFGTRIEKHGQGMTVFISRANKSTRALAKFISE